LGGADDGAVAAAAHGEERMLLSIDLDFAGITRDRS
jgi:hypothetical protein